MACGVVATRDKRVYHCNARGDVWAETTAREREYVRVAAADEVRGVETRVLFAEGFPAIRVVRGEGQLQPQIVPAADPFVPDAIAVHVRLSGGTRASTMVLSADGAGPAPPGARTSLCIDADLFDPFTGDAASACSTFGALARLLTETRAWAQLVHRARLLRVPLFDAAWPAAKMASRLLVRALGPAMVYLPPALGEKGAGGLIVTPQKQAVYAAEPVFELDFRRFYPSILRALLPAACRDFVDMLLAHRELKSLSCVLSGLLYQPGQPLFSPSLYNAMTGRGRRELQALIDGLGPQHQLVMACTDGIFAAGPEPPALSVPADLVLELKRVFSVMVVSNTNVYAGLTQAGDVVIRGIAAPSRALRETVGAVLEACKAERFRVDAARAALPEAETRYLFAHLVSVHTLRTRASEADEMAAASEGPVCRCAPVFTQCVSADCAAAPPFARFWGLLDRLRTPAARRRLLARARQPVEQIRLLPIA